MKATVKVIYMDHDNYMKYHKDIYDRRGLKFNPEFHDRMFRRSAMKKNIDGVDYWMCICHKNFEPKQYWDIAEKYGFPVYEEMEWCNI